MIRKIIPLLGIIFTLFFVGCKNDVKSDDEGIPNLKEIKDFAKYQSIGAGSYNTVSRSVRSVDNSLGIDTTEGCKLIGELSDGSIELIKFIDVDGETKSQNWYLTVLHIDSNFAFVGFNLKKSNTILTDSLRYGDANYVLDLRDGNLYSVNIFAFEKIGLDSYDKDGTPVTFVQGTLNETRGTYKFSIKEVDGIKKLEIKYAFDIQSGMNVAVMRGKKDRYGNIIKHSSMYRNGIYKELSEYYYYNDINGIFYTRSDFNNPEKKINENGEEVVNGDSFQIYYIKFDTDSNNGTDENQILKETSNYFIYCKYYHDVYKVTYTDADHLSYTVQPLIEYTDNEYYMLILSNNNSHYNCITDGENILFEKEVRTSDTTTNHYIYLWNIETESFEDEPIFELTSYYPYVEYQKNCIYAYKYDDDFNKVEYFIYPDGTVTNSYKDYSNNKVYLVPIA